MTATVTATPEPLNDPPRVQIAVNWTSHTSAMIVRHDPDGRVRPVRTAEPLALSAGVGLVYDYESYFGSAMTYDAIDGSSTISSSSVTLSVTDVWLRHPGIPSLSIQPELAGEQQATRNVNRTVHMPIGRQYGIAVSDGRRKAKSGQLLLRTWTLEEEQALLDVLDDSSILLLDVPVANRWGLSHQYMSLGDLAEQRLVEEIASNEYRQWTLPFDVVDRPAGGIQSQRTYANLLEFATYSLLDAAYASYTDLLSGHKIGS